MKSNVSEWVALISLISGGFSTIWGAYRWWLAAHQKAYAAKIQFEAIAQTQLEQNKTLDRIEAKLDTHDGRLCVVEKIVGGTSGRIKNY